MLKTFSYKDFNLNSFLQKRTTFPFHLETQVNQIINKVKKNGDQALIQLAKKFDKTDLNKTGFKTTKDEIRKAFERVKKSDPFYIKTIKIIISRISKFHKMQIEKSWTCIKTKDEITGQLVNPIEKVCIYTPGGNAFYPSTLIMNIIPAQCAGVENIYVTTPIKENQNVKDELLAVLYLLNINEIYHIGGAQAIAAFALGTKKIPKVYKIFGPGNIYVTLAKKLLIGTIDIDMIAGPSEILIIADKNSNPEHIAADMLAQSEHDELAAAILITNSNNLIKKTDSHIKKLLKKYPCKTAEKALKKNGLAIKINKFEDAFHIANQIAPEHLEILLPQPKKYLSKIKNAGSVFLGEYTPESVGDYFAGPNHTLPTMSTAKFYSQLGVYDFVKRTGFSYFSKKKLNESKDYICKIAEVEKLFFHSLSVKLRK